MPPARKFKRYIGTGGLSAAADAGGFVVPIKAGAGLIVADARFAVATVVSYLLSSRLVFDHCARLRGSLFFAFELVGMSINVIVTSTVATWTALPLLGAKIAGIGIAFVANFALNLGVVFRGREGAR